MRLFKLIHVLVLALLMATESHARTVNFEYSNDGQENNVNPTNDATDTKQRYLRDPSSFSQNQRKTTVDLFTPTPMSEEMKIMASIGDADILHQLFLSLDYDETNNTMTMLAQQQKRENPNGNLVVRSEGLGPLLTLPWSQTDTATRDYNNTNRLRNFFNWNVDWSLNMYSRMMRYFWQGKFLEFPSPDPPANYRSSVDNVEPDMAKFINQYTGIQWWTGHVYPGKISQAIDNTGPLQPLLAAQPLDNFDDKPSLIMDYRRGNNFRTNVVDECRPLSKEKLLALNVDISSAQNDSDNDGIDRWSYVWFCRGSAPRFLQFGGERVFILFFLLHIMPETITYNMTMP